MIFKEKKLGTLKALKAIQIILNNIEIIKKNADCEGYIDNTLFETFENEMFNLRKNILDDVTNYDKINELIEKEIEQNEERGKKCTNLY